MSTKSFILKHSTEASKNTFTAFWHQGNRLKPEAQFPTNTNSNLMLTYSSYLWKSLSCYRRNTCKEPYSLTGLKVLYVYFTLNMHWNYDAYESKDFSSVRQDAQTNY